MPYMPFLVDYAPEYGGDEESDAHAVHKHHPQQELEERHKVQTQHKRKADRGRCETNKGALV